MEKIRKKITKLIKECGLIMKNADRSVLDIEAKAGHSNFVTKYDEMIQEKIQKGLYEIMPEAAFFGEEGEHSSFPDREYVFIVDPIDGTTNFMKDLALSCIALCLTRNKERIFSVVYNPFSDELFTAAKGEGAFLNGERIRVSSQPLSMGLAVFGTAPYYEGLPDKAFAKAREYLDKCIDVRRLGSAELDLCFVACGRAEIYFEPLIQPWDIAAGSLIVEEAGGTVKRWNGTDIDIENAGDCVAYGSGIKMDRFED